MPTDVKLNAEELPDSFLDQLCAECEWEYGEKVVGKQTLWRIVSELQARRALNNSKPTPAVGDDGLIAELRRAYPVTITDASTLIARTASALAAAHSQHEADVARIGGLTEALKPLAAAADQFDRMPVKDPEQWSLWSTTSNHPDYPSKTITVGDARRARSALAKVKP